MRLQVLGALLGSDLTPAANRKDIWQEAIQAITGLLVSQSKRDIDLIISGASGSGGDSCSEIIVFQIIPACDSGIVPIVIFHRGKSYGFQHQLQGGFRRLADNCKISPYFGDSCHCITVRSFVTNFDQVALSYRNRGIYDDKRGP